MTTRSRWWGIAALVVAVAVLATSVVWTVGRAASARAATTSHARPARLGDSPRTSADQGAARPDLPGAVVDLTAVDMGGRAMMGGTGGWTGGRMVLRSDRLDVPAGAVSLRLTNIGSVDHEVVVLPVAEGQRIGGRDVSADGRVDESDSLGEASRTDGPGAGDGIAPGTTGWVTLDLVPGRYELVCNLPGHYAAGMDALLVVR